MARRIPRTDVLLILMGAPHESDQVTSVLRLVQAMLERGGRVQVWACGHATLLTQQALGENKPRNFADWTASYPTTATLVREMLAAFPDQLYWYGCRFCSDDRGAHAHLPEVVMRGPSAFAANSAAADKTLMVGVI
ncbi:hypothetical protein LE181_21215 [Streptomyces sp. SCA3-4]|uniref:hypothetical protein n=1 Tax=Streptomyces sichuanensis TaxID=2871810 RepID=UPI001CE3907B|nr:hypothetical protein [Streptomyces sichuanensis]MCA6094679.1 hypothetical protein [Streptomyces sichuanensis]